jgi:methyl-accepting chemotaxis protein
MNVTTDSVILKKLEDFRVRRRNLILLRGICTGFVTLILTFTTIALIDFATQARMPDDLRTGLSILGYAVVIWAVWKTSARMLLHLPSHRELARLLEQIKPEMKQDILSAVELGSQGGEINDSLIFRKLVQEKVSGQVHELDIISLLPFTMVKRWIQASLVLLLFSFGLFSYTDFGPKLQRLMGRALLPGANIAPVTNVEVTLLIPDENTTITPKNEPLRFLALVNGKEGDETYGQVELQIKEKKKVKRVSMFSRTTERFALDYNVGSNPFDYRVWVDSSPRTAWRSMDVASRPYIIGFTKTYHFPQYTELPPQVVEEDKGHLSAWEDTRVELKLHLSQAVSSGSLFLDWTGKKPGTLSLSPSENGRSLGGTIMLKQSGTYRALDLIDQKIGWKGKPSPRYEINVKVDVAPSISWLAKQKVNLLLAPEDILSLEGWATDDLGLNRIEFHYRNNQGKWKNFILPGDRNAKGKNKFPISFDIDLLSLKPKPGDQALIKLVAYDLKGSMSETDPINLSFVSRNFDLTLLNILEQKNRVMESWEEVAHKNRASAKEFQQISKGKNYQEGMLESDLENLEKMNDDLRELELFAYGKNLQVLTTMPRGADAQEIAMLSQSMGKLAKTSRSQNRIIIEQLENIRNDPKEIKKWINKLGQNVQKNAIGFSGNLRNVARNLLDQHILTVATSYLAQLSKQQKELSKMAKEDHSSPFLVRRQEIALHQWEAISKVFTYERRGIPAAIKNASREQGKLLDTMENISATKNEFAQQVEKWSRMVEQFYKETERNLSNQANHNFAQDRKNLFFNLGYTWGNLKKLATDWKTLEQNAEIGQSLSDQFNREILLNIDALSMRSEVEHSRKDPNSGFVKDAGQASRALLELKQKLNDPAVEKPEQIENLSDVCLLISDSFRVLEMYQIVLQSAKQAVYFTNLEKRSVQGAKARGERARQWAMAVSFWEPTSNFLREANLPREAVDILRSLNTKSFAKEISKEMKNRVSRPDNQFLAMDIQGEEIITELEKVLILLKPEATQARKIINELAPTLAELARALSKQTRTRQKEAEEIKNKEEQELAEKRKESISLQDKQQVLNQDIDSFTIALRQEAGVQNLVDKEGREIARDADDAAALVQTRKKSVQENLSDALQANTISEQNEALESTIETQQKLAETLDLIADHFEKVNGKKDASETREELRKVEDELGIKEEVEKQFAQAEKLGELAKLPPQALLAELEKELKKNQPMKEELSDISKETIEEAIEDLEEAKKDEMELAKKLESSDPELTKKKKELAKKLEQIAKESENLAKNQVRQAVEKSEDLVPDNTSEKMKQAKENLEEVAKQTKDTAKPANTARALGNDAKELAQALKEAQGVLNDSSEKINNLANLTPEDAKKSAEKARVQLDEALETLAKKREVEKELNQKADRARKEAAEAKAVVEKAQEEEAFKKKTAQKTAQDASLQPENQVAQKEAKEAILQAQKAEDNKHKKEELAKKAIEQAEQTNEELAVANQETETQKEETEQKRDLANLTEKQAQEFENPATQKKVQANAKQATQKSEDAKDKAKELEKKALEVAKQLEELERASKPAQEEIAKGLYQQKEIAEQVFEAADELARTARHEERMENEQLAEEIADVAKNSLEVAQEAIPKTAQALQNEALLNELKNLATEANELASKTDDRKLSDPLKQAAEETLTSLDGNQGLDQIKDAAKEFAQQAQQTAGEFAQAEEKTAQTNEEMKKKSEKKEEQAKTANQLAQDANKEAESLKKEAQNLVSLAKEAQGESENAEAKSSQEPNNPETTEASKLAQDAAKAAQENADKANAQAAEAMETQQSLAKKAEQSSQEAKDAKNKANETKKLAESISQQAQEAEELADSAKEFSENLPDSPVFSDLIQDNDSLPSPSEALANTTDQLDEQIDTLSHLNSEQAENSQTNTQTEIPSMESELASNSNTQASPSTTQPTTNETNEDTETTLPKSLPDGSASQNEPSDVVLDSPERGELASTNEVTPSPNQPTGNENPGETVTTPTTSPPDATASQNEAPAIALDSPEVSQALAQTLDFLDQALNPSSNPFATEGLDGEENQAGEQDTPAEITGNENSEPGELGKPKPGNGYGQGSGGHYSCDGALTNASAQAMIAAARALAEASQTQSQAMAQARSPIQNTFNGTNSLESNDQSFREEQELTFQEIPELDKEEFEEWGKLPPKLAKDLMESRRENVSGDYRNRVEAYFRAMASKARKIK